jgi:hypothetical protein
MTKRLVVSLLFCAVIVYGQREYPSKLQLTKSLLKQTKVRGKSYDATNWFTFQSDSTYQVADTLIFYNNPRHRFGKHTCYFIDWNFHKKDAFWLQTLKLCEDPRLATNVIDYKVFNFEVSDRQWPLILKVFSNNVLVDKFEVLSLNKEPIVGTGHESTDVLILRRVRLSN